MATICLAVLYIGSFALNSYYGGYWNKLERDGRDRWAVGLSMPTAILWQPRFGYWAPFRADLLGTFYSPLIRLDRSFVHVTRYVSDPDFYEWARNEATASDVHPKFRAEYLALKAKQR